MSAQFPNSYDMLSISGILPYDVNQIVNGAPSPYLQQYSNNNLIQTPNNDQFQNQEKIKKPINPKKVGLAALITYLSGAALSKSTNPLKGAKAIGKTIWNIIKLPIKIFK